MLYILVCDLIHQLYDVKACLSSFSVSVLYTLFLAIPDFWLAQSLVTRHLPCHADTDFSNRSCSLEQYMDF